MRARRRVPPVVAGAVAILASGGALAFAGGGAGAPGAGDPFFPNAGNGGYEVDHYGLRISYRPGDRHLAGVETLAATATQGLTSFDLDLRGLNVHSVTVGGRHASFTRSGQELVITPHAAIDDGDRFRVELHYSGKPQTITDPDGSPDGWIPTDDGAWVASEPQGSPSWYAANDHPTDKAAFDIAITVPRGLTGVSNGRLARSFVHHGKHTFVWHESAPMATYLATATIGKFEVRRSHFDGLRSYVAVDPSLHGSFKTLRKIPQIVRFFGHKFGPYPFRDVGGIADPSPAGYSLETQTRPLFAGSVDIVTLAHELAHQWFGDSVSLERWKEIWLNEGFATFAEWLWIAHSTGTSLHSQFETAYSVPDSNDAYWNPPAGNPSGPAEIFDGTIYERGGMTLEALREKIGSHDFFKILRRWTSAHRHANGTTAEFENLAETVSGHDLSQFFSIWLDQAGKPAPGSW